eukprot:4657992-Amphidinium_carterae.1
MVAPSTGDRGSRGASLSDLETELERCLEMERIIARPRKNTWRRVADTTTCTAAYQSDNMDKGGILLRWTYFGRLSASILREMGADDSTQGKACHHGFMTQHKNQNQKASRVLTWSTRENATFAVAIKAGDTLASNGRNVHKTGQLRILKCPVGNRVSEVLGSQGKALQKIW